MDKEILDFKTSPKEFRERARKLKNKYNDELQEYRDSLLKEGKRFGHDTYSYNMITIQMFEAEKGVTYKDGEYFEYRMDYSPIIDGFSNGYGDYAGLNEGFVGYIFMQRTGLYDKNNKKIREGDIIQFEGENKYGVIVFRHGCFSYDLHLYGSVIKNNWLQERVDHRTDTIEQEVVGNVFENSSLLQ